MKYTPKQIEKYRRRKYINELEKIAKNLFKMFRNRDVNKEQFIEKFYRLRDRLKDYNDVRLNSEYHNRLKSYIEKLYRETGENFQFDEVREINMTMLNRLQKLKNRISYKRNNEPPQII